MAHRIFCREIVERKRRPVHLLPTRRSLFLRARVCPRKREGSPGKRPGSRKLGDISSLAWRCWNLQKITQAPLSIARQFSRFRIQSVTNSEKRPKLRKMWVFVGVSERGAPSANTNQVIQYMYGRLIYLCVYIYIYTHTHTHTSRAREYLSVSVHSLLAATCRKSPQRMCGHPRSIEDLPRYTSLLRQDRLIYFHETHNTLAWQQPEKRTGSILFW